MESALYAGWIRHRRRSPVEHAFRYPLVMLYLDLDELNEVFAGRWLWSTARPALAWFRRADHLGNPAVPLGAAVRDLVEQRTGVRPSGPIRLLTHPRYFGYVFNPVSFYYCFDRGGRVDTIVADVTNTPWNERHQYVLRPPATTPVSRFRLRKAFHVSPFMPMDIEYDWRFSSPSASLAVHVISRHRGRPIFDATLLVRRREIAAASLAGTLARYPAMTAQVIGRIHWQALRLWRKRAPFHPHPDTREANEVTT